ncbi:MAG: DUF4136 domain-containing protein [Halieaceae bacterium]
MRIKIVSVLSSTLLLFACATSGPRINSAANPGTDFFAFGTFNIMQPAGTDRANGVRTPLTGMLASAVTRELESRGMRQSDSPDILVNFFVNIEERMDVRTVPTASSFHGYRRGRYRSWPNYETRVRQYTQGTLAIDLVDRADNMLVWEAAAQNRLPRNMTEISQQQIDEVVAAIMKELPR